MKKKMTYNKEKNYQQKENQVYTAVIISIEGHLNSYYNFIPYVQKLSKNLVDVIMMRKTLMEMKTTITEMKNWAYQTLQRKILISLQKQKLQKMKQR